MPSYRTQPTDRDTPNIHLVSDTPDLGQMTQEMHTALTGASDFYDRAQRSLDVRECVWPNQSPDGRKHSTPNEPAFPWDNASDARVRTVDMIINELVKKKRIALARMNVQAVPTPAHDMERGQRLATLIRWYLRGPMSNEAQREIELLANYQETYGSAVLGVGWHQPLAYENKIITIDEISAMAMEAGGPAALADVGEVLFDPRQEETALEWILSMSPLLTRREARRVLEDWRTSSEAEIAMPYVAESRPSLMALQCMQDVIFPVNTWDLQRSRFIAQRELLTETELREKAEGREEWDEDFVEALLQRPGDTFNNTLGAMALSARQQQLTGLWNTTLNETEEYFEAWHFYHRATFRGVPCLYRTVMSPALGEGRRTAEALCGKHEMIEGAPEYPHIEFVREFRARSILSSRGLPEVLDTDQREIKVQRDSRVDLASVTTAPMMRKEPRVGGEQYAFGPGIVVSAKRGDLEPIVWPMSNQHSVEVENATKRGVNEYVGRAGEGIPPELVRLHEEAGTQAWLERWQIVAHHIGNLAQRYTPPLTIAKLTGISNKPLDITPENIAGDFAVILTFDPRFASPEFVFGMLERIEKYVIPLDSNAIIERNELIYWAFAGIDPGLADRVVRDSDAAQQSEIEDEQNNLALMVTGQAPPMKLKGQNYAARLNVLQSSLQANAPYYQLLLQSRPDFRALLEQRVAFLEQQIAQDKNRAIGIFGTNPSAASPGMQGMQGMNGAAAGGGMPELGQFAMGGAA